jgi:hypothetical protein
VIHIISTALNAPTRKRCEESVHAAQLACDQMTSHHYIEAGEQAPRLCALENFTREVRALDPGDIVASVDGDDWLPNDRVLCQIAEIYTDPDAWMTWGSFCYADGRSGFAEDYTADEWKDVRSAPWKATHLKTMRAGLFHKLTDADLKRDGLYRDLAWDMVVQFPMLEMAGPEHARFVRDILYVYNFHHAWEHTASGPERERERLMVAEIRNLPRRERLVAL